MNENEWRDARPIDEMKFGQELEPKIVEVMKMHPWPESAFTWAPPEKVPDDFDPVKARALALERWKLVMRDIPTDEAAAAWKSIHAVTLLRIRTLLTQCNVKIAEDIKQLGCTGCARYGLTLDDIKFLRIGIAGGGVGLPCFVPPDRYCLAHGTTGGLQSGQAQQYVDQVEAISREATPAERGHDALVSKARYAERERDAHGMLHGQVLPEGWQENVDAIRAEGGIDDILTAGKHEAAVRDFMEVPAVSAWRCPEHDKTNWACRYCVAQAVVDGDLIPAYAVEEYTVESAVEGGIEAKTFSTGATPEELLAEITEASKTTVPKLVIYARIATFTRKLARD